MNDEYDEQLEKTLKSIVELISIDEQIAQGKKKGNIGWRGFVDLKKERTKIKKQIYGYIRWLSYKGKYVAYE